MKAVVMNGTGGREMLEHVERPDPVTGPGQALGVQTLREDRENETEFMTISYWENVEAMSKFTGGDPTQVHHLERHEEFLIELPKEVQILRLLTSHGVPGSTS